MQSETMPVLRVFLHVALLVSSVCYKYTPNWGRLLLGRLGPLCDRQAQFILRNVGGHCSRAAAVPAQY